MDAVPLLLGGAARKEPGASSLSQFIGSAVVDVLVSAALTGVFLFYSVLVGRTFYVFACMDAAEKLFSVRNLEGPCSQGEHLRAPSELGLVGSLVLVVLVCTATMAFWCGKYV
jgi:hypothetical protein